MKTRLQSKQKANLAAMIGRALSRPLPRRTLLKGALATAPLLLIGPSLLRPKNAQAQNIGPSTTTEPYLLPSTAWRRSRFSPLAIRLTAIAWSAFPTASARSAIAAAHSLC